jgi:tRNA (cytidine/uridine-2'-O-)-methyltransferase
MPDELPRLGRHDVQLALLQPQIAPNTGNIARLCVATATRLHLVRPLGFVLTDRNLRRSAMDYWARLNLSLHDDTQAFVRAIAPCRAWFFSSKAPRSLWDVAFADGDVLVFGNETRGLPEELYASQAQRLVRIAQAPQERCLYLSSAAAIALYEALRQIQHPFQTRA